MRGTLGLRTMPPQLAALAPPTLLGCGGALRASWPAVAGATGYDLQWTSGPDSNTLGPWTTVTGANSVYEILAAESVIAQAWYFVRVRARTATGRATAWGNYSLRQKALPPPPPTAALTGGLGLSIAAPGPATGDDVYVANQYDAQVEYGYSSTGPWSAFAEYYEVAATAAVTYSQPPSGVWYRARIRYRGTNCSDAWVGEWGAWSSVVSGGPAEGEGGGEVGGD